MKVNLSNLTSANETIAIALSGGADSVALLHYMLSCSQLYQFKVKAINVEHGIRGEESKKDSEFVCALCKEMGVELLTYQVDCPTYAKEHKLTLEQAGRILRYNCFYDAINQKKCDKVATAHHLSDNAESVLFNLFRGTGLKGVVGIEENYCDKIIRPFLEVEKTEILEYVKTHNLSYVTDLTNFDDEFTRNYIRLNIMPEIKKAFPEAEKSIARFSKIVKLENDYIEEQAKAHLQISEDYAQIKLPCPPVLLGRCAIKAMQALGTTKDWEKVHIDALEMLSTLKNGVKFNLKNGIIAIKEYDKLVLYREKDKFTKEFPFSLGERFFNGFNLEIKKVEKPLNLKDGFFADLDKIPQTALLRTKRDGDKITKFGGGTKKLNDYLTDKKVPLRIRDNLILLADKNEVLVIFGVAISDKIKVDDNTKRIITFINK